MKSMPLIRCAVLPLLLSLPLAPVYPQQKERFMFYNVENLFDPRDDSLKMDDEFTPGGNMHWTEVRLQAKLSGLYKVIMSAGDYQPPAMIGLCEVENSRVLGMLTGETPLERYKYRYVHYDSPDERGMDVAFLYRPDVFSLLESQPVALCEINVTDPTRDILYISGILHGLDTLHVLLNHWPSRYGGAGPTGQLRIKAARRLKELIDSLQERFADPAVIVAGDMNDECADESLKYLGISLPASGISPLAICRLQHEYSPGIHGTTRYRGFWYEFDHIFVSGTLTGSGRIFLEPELLRVHGPGFLLEKDRLSGGMKPFRTYSGYRYRGGYSDHLPVTVDLACRSSRGWTGSGNRGMSCDRTDRRVPGFPGR